MDFFARVGFFDHPNKKARPKPRFGKFQIFDRSLREWAGYKTRQLVVAVAFFHAFMAFLRIERQGRNGARFETL